jgi:mRNA-degrading endonuclease RelE of RelBE toxin-antitoxin system
MKQHKVIVQPEAQEEVDAIRIYQHTLDPKRGQRFIDAFQACLEQLKANPSFQKRKGNHRHLMLHKLPYRVVFEVEGNTVFVYQVHHTSRKPSKKFGP